MERLKNFAFFVVYLIGVFVFVAYPLIPFVLIVVVVSLLFLPSLFKKDRRPFPGYYRPTAVADSPEVIADRNRRKEARIRTELATLRENISRSTCQEIHSEVGLLRDRLLNEFAVKRPTTRDEWFQKIDFQLRDNTRSSQVREYLQTVLETIARHNDP